MKPSYVIHDEKRWYVVRETRVDGTPAYVLRDPRGRCILARAAECEVWRRPAEQVRVFQAGGYVIEIRTAGDVVRQVDVRRARSSRRWPTSVPAIYSMTVKAHVARQKQASKRRRI
jgi:hypothetical protein